MSRQSHQFLNESVALHITWKNWGNIVLSGSRELSEVRIWKAFSDDCAHRRITTRVGDEHAGLRNDVLKVSRDTKCIIFSHPKLGMPIFTNIAVFFKLFKRGGGSNPCSKRTAEFVIA